MHKAASPEPVPIPAGGTPQPLSPAQSDAAALKTMQGFPPAASYVVDRANVMVFPNTRWSFRHLREVLPTASVWAGPRTHVSRLSQAAHHSIRTLAFSAPDGGRTAVGDWLDATYTDSFLVMHRGRIACEHYRRGVQAHEPHMLMSDTKSVTGLLATDLIVQGKLDPSAPVPQYLPELAKSGWADATVQQTLDMATGIDFSEDYADPESNFLHYVIAAGIAPAPENYGGAKSLYRYLPTIGKKGAHGQRFTYRTVNTEVLGWIVQRISQKKLNELLSEKIWQPMGAENDAYYLVDRDGMAMAGGGLNATLRDVARFAEMVRCRGRYNGGQILPPEVFDTIFLKDYAVKVPADEYGQGRNGYAYRNYWWLTNNADGAVECWGINGQLIHINPVRETVIVKHSSRPEASNGPYSAMAAAAFAAIDRAFGP